MFTSLTSFEKDFTPIASVRSASSKHRRLPASTIWKRRQWTFTPLICTANKLASCCHRIKSGEVRSCDQFARWSSCRVCFFPHQGEDISKAQDEKERPHSSRAAASWIPNEAMRCCLIPGLRRHLVSCLQGLLLQFSRAHVCVSPPPHMNLDNLPNFWGSATSVGAGVNPGKRKVFEYDLFLCREAGCCLCFFIPVEN